MVDQIRWLLDLGREDIGIAGGKGANLGELTGAGFDVPDGFVVTTAAYEDFVAAHGLRDVIGQIADGAREGSGATAEAASRIAELFADGELSPELAGAIREAYLMLGGGPVAVRSSATAEDLAEASFAGQQDTYLNVVGEAAVLAAVRECWASLWTDRAIWYRAEHGVTEASLAVVVQRMVPAVAAGVMFTANPANGRGEETVITAAWGLGEAVVSGMVDTDTIVVDTELGRVLSSRIADKAVRVDPALDGSRTRTSQTSASQRSAAVLDETDALRLAEVGKRIEAHFGAPQDIEWALADQHFRIVQSRPITALPERTGPVPEEWPVPEPGLYFRASITEQLPDPLTPLFGDLMATAVPAGLNRLLAELAPGRPDSDIGFPTINGYAFYRYSYQAFGAMLKISPKLIPILIGDDGVWIEKRWRERLAEYRAGVSEVNALEVSSASTTELLEAVGRLVDEVAYYYTAVQTIIPLASMAELIWTGVYNKLLKRAGDPAADTYLLGFDSEPIRAERALFDLARWARQQPGLAAIIAGAGAGVLAEAAPPGVDPETWTEWLTRIRAYLGEHGHTLYNLDFVNPVPADNPAPVLQALRFSLRQDAPDPYQRQERTADAREAATARLLSRLSGWRHRQVRGLLEWAQHTGPLREDALAAMGLFLPPARRLLSEIGRRLMASGVIKEPMDVCWLTLAEVAEIAAALDVNGSPAFDLVDLVATRKEVARGERLARPPQYLPKSAAMDIFAGMFPAKDGTAAEGVLAGTAGSGGVVTGRARVLAGPEDFAAFQPGEVLVASITTPAYTPLFTMAAGVVTDIGGVLSHGSIVAREYGIPSVLGTGSATRLIHTGDEITVDGTAGTVMLPNAATEPVEEADKSAQTSKWVVRIGVGALAVATVAHFWHRASRRRRR